MELIVDLDDFIGILKSSKTTKKLGKRNISNESVCFSYDGKYLQVSVVGALKSIPASGNWDGVVSIPLSIYRLFHKVPPTQNPLKLTFDNCSNKLIIDGVNFKATWAGRNSPDIK